MLTTPKCSCGGPGEARHLWSYRQSKKAQMFEHFEGQWSPLCRRGDWTWGIHGAYRRNEKWWVPHTKCCWLVMPMKDLTGGVWQARVDATSRCLGSGSDPVGVKMEICCELVSWTLLVLWLVFLPAFYRRRNFWGEWEHTKEILDHWGELHPPIL